MRSLQTDWVASQGEKSAAWLQSPGSDCRPSGWTMASHLISQSSSLLFCRRGQYPHSKPHHVSVRWGSQCLLFSFGGKRLTLVTEEQDTGEEGTVSAPTTPYPYVHSWVFKQQITSHIMQYLVRGVVDQAEVLFQPPGKQAHTQNSWHPIDLKVRYARTTVFSVPPKNTPKAEAGQQVVINALFGFKESEKVTT